MKRSPHSQPDLRSGSTLTEVLIATMVLSIGVISVGTLFPLSMARTIRANQITQSTIHRYNTEGIVESLKLNSKWMFVVEPVTNANALNVNNHFPGLIGDDDGDGSANVDAGQGVNGYDLGPDGLPGKGYGSFENDDGINGINDPGEVGWSEPASGNNYVSDDTPIMDTGELQFGGADTTKVVIDPLGWHQMSTGTYQNNFGSDAYPFTVGGTRLPRLNGGYHANNQWLSTNPRVRPTFWRERIDNTSWDDELPAGGYGFTFAQAEELTTLQDQYSTVIDTTFTDVAIGAVPPGRTRLDLSSDLPDPDLSSIRDALRAGLKVQALFFGIKGATNPIEWTESRFLFAPPVPPAPQNPDMANGVIGWSAGLPAQFQIERVVIQIQNLDFTWMVTARLSDGGSRPQMDIVIFHKRQFTTADEQLYVATQGEDFNNNGDLDAGEDINGNNNLDSLTNIYRVTFPAGSRPAADVGGWMFDVEHCRWYQITSLVETATTLTLTLEHGIIETIDGTSDNPNQIAVAFMKNIVDVFPIGSK